jgi:subtilisin-like proprotein convertase family protein
MVRRRVCFAGVVACLVAHISSASAELVQVFEIQPNGAIPDIGTIHFDMLVNPVANSRIVVDVDAGLLIPHTWQGDLKISLSHLDTGQSSLLFDRPGSPQNTIFGFSADNYGNPTTNQLFYLDDVAAGVYDSPPFGNVNSPGIANVTGNWLTEGSLAAFDGIDATGIWRLTIEDFAGGDVGALNVFQLRITTIPEPNAMIGWSIVSAIIGAFGGRPVRRRIAAS